MPEVLDNGRAGVLVGPGDAAALRAGIAAIMDHSAAAAERAGNACRRVREVYSSRAMAERYLEVYRQLLPETAARSAKVQSETICL
jgi:glycosyltransferase involved in cell wall biosynthesis